MGNELKVGFLSRELVSNDRLKRVIETSGQYSQAKGDHSTAEAMKYVAERVDMMRASIKFLVTDIDTEKLIISGVLIVPRVLPSPFIHMRCGSVPFECKGDKEKSAT
eukprot:TRINITY_DN105112_c1_g1_i1.p2 TRINITY_DN105112_c1_g1~~TRINITY_DN105112_c1_g1_i1.p2  ORF type:complete len:118 (+),score=14.59 TRINITY_DN105112_c1_g1_i1:35-355(+)